MYLKNKQFDTSLMLALPAICAAFISMAKLMLKWVHFKACNPLLAVVLNWLKDGRRKKGKVKRNFEVSSCRA